MIGVSEMFGYRIKVSFSSKRPWNYIKLHKAEGYYHFIWFKLSVLIEDTVSELYPICAQCDSPEIGEKGVGDESWTICDSCLSVEQGYKYVNLIDYERL